MGSGIFKRGYDAVEEEKKRQDKLSEERGKKLFTFFLPNDGDEAEVLFLTEEPINFHEHTERTVRNGKEAFNYYVCTGEDCKRCANDNPTFKGAYLIYDKRPYEYTDKDGNKKKGEGQVRMYKAGAKVLSQLSRISKKYGLTKRVLTIIRTGTKKSTSYSFERGEEERLTPDEIRALLPEKIREMYNGTADSLYEIVQEQLILGTGVSSGQDDDDEDSAPVKSGSDKVVSVDDDDEDEALKSKKPALSPAKKLLGRKPVENSAKALFRGKHA
jgi:hypothetical protein